MAAFLLYMEGSMMNISIFKKIIFTIFSIYTAILYFFSFHHKTCIFTLDSLYINHYFVRYFCDNLKFLPCFFSAAFICVILIIWENNLINLNLKKILNIDVLKLSRIIVFLSGVILLALDIENGIKFFLVGLLLTIFSLSFFQHEQNETDTVLQTENSLEKSAQNVISTLDINKYLADQRKDYEELIIYHLVEFELEIKNGTKIHEKIIHFPFTPKIVIIYHWDNYSLVLKDGKRTVAHFDSELDSVVLDNILDDDDLPLAFGMSLAYRAFIIQRKNDTYGK